MAKQQMQRSAKSRQRPRTARLRDHRSEQGEPMSIRQPRAIWVEQCDAARDIRDCYGLSAALDYVVTEKLMNFASAWYQP